MTWEELEEKIPPGWVVLNIWWEPMGVEFGRIESDKLNLVLEGPIPKIIERATSLALSGRVR